MSMGTIAGVVVAVAVVAAVAAFALRRGKADPDTPQG
jgi:hypothetical protein